MNTNKAKFKLGTKNITKFKFIFSCSKKESCVILHKEDYPFFFADIDR